ncbi:putative metal-binding motif-containing protein [Muricauda sp. ANG21]|uniref:putative metal-binding motif-containing protein n=1 Tax=Allomuricauda sp. ANG21 TaxID=3042468 RepID=UPI00345294A6
MRKNNFFGLLAMIMGFGFLAMVSCSKDDECVNRTYYLDKDYDNFGTGAGTTACKPPKSTSGQYVLKNGDTNDEDPNVNPECELVFYIDDDGDGFPSPEPFYFCENPDDTKYTEVGENFDCNDNDSSINPDVFITYYPDADSDGYGDPNGQTVVVQGCESAPADHVSNSDDCDDTDANRNPEAAQITYYNDGDDDGYGNEDEFDVRDACDPTPEFNYALQAGDCNDNDPSINPDAEENPNDGIDSNCDGAAETIIWSGPEYQFNKPANADWESNTEYHDQLTESVALTRSNSKGYLTNINWWLNTIGQIPTEDEDLEWEYRGRKAETNPVANVGDAQPSGGPQGIRWAILEQGDDTEAWDNFNLYGELGDPTNFYSFNNIVSICSLLDGNETLVNIIDDFGVMGASEEFSDFGDTNVSSVTGKTLGVWLVEEDIYFTLTFTEMPGFTQGRPMTYTRSTPNN